MAALATTATAALDAADGAAQAGAAAEAAQAEAEAREKALEDKHFNSCVRAFFDYGPWLAPEFARRARHRARLSDAHIRKLGGRGLLVQRHQTAMNCLDANARLLRAAVDTSATEALRALGRPRKDPTARGEAITGRDDHFGYHSVASPNRHMVKVRSTLKQIVRDWTTLGKPERDACYAPLMVELGTHLPVTPANFGRQRVLVPGSGLGRLVFDLAVAGYDAQGNEFSYFMLLMGDYIMNRSSGKECFEAFPFLGEANNVFERAEEFAGVRFPDVHPVALVQEAPGQVNMSVAAGEFLQCYGGADNAGQWDGLATCFFIDTAPNVIEYIEAIHAMLRPGGIWTSIGPLQYHWATFRDEAQYEQDERYHQSVEFAFGDIRRVMLSTGFEMLREERRECKYSARPGSCKHTVYDCVFFTARKK